MEARAIAQALGPPLRLRERPVSTEGLRRTGPARPHPETAIQRDNTWWLIPNCDSAGWDKAGQYPGRRSSLHLATGGLPAGGVILCLLPFATAHPATPKAIPGALHCTIEGFSPPWGEAGNPALYTFSFLNPDSGLPKDPHRKPPLL